MNLCSISIYLLICIVIRHGRKTAIFAVDAQADSTTSGESVPKSGENQIGSGPEAAANPQGSVTPSFNPSDTNSPVPVPLDIDISQDSDHFTFQQSGTSRILTVKSGYLISELRRGSNVLHTFADGRYPYQVTVERNGDQEDLKVSFPSTGNTGTVDNELEIEESSKQNETTRPEPVEAAPVQGQAEKAQVTQAQQPGAGTAQVQQNQATQHQASTALTPTRRLAVSSFTTPGQAFTQDRLGQPHNNFAANLHFVTMTNAVLNVDDTTQYNIYVGQDGYIYNFNDHAQCVEIKFVNNTIWKIGEARDYPTNVEFSLSPPPHVLIATRNQTYTYRLVDRKWQLGSHITNVKSQMDPSNVKIEIGTDATCAHTISDETKYTIKTFDELNIFYYEFYPNVYCAGVIYQNQYLWKYAPNFGTYFPRRIYFHKDVMTVVVDFESFYLLYKFDNTWKFDSKVDKNRFHDDQLELVTYDPQNNTANVNDATQYRVIEHYYLRQYKFLPNSMCISLRYQQKPVWARSNQFQNHFPKSIVYNIKTRNFFIDFDADWYYVYVFDQDADKWYLVHKDESNKPADLPEVTAESDPSQQANESQNANPNTRLSDPDDDIEVDDIDVRDMRSGSMGSDATDVDPARRGGRHGSIPQDTHDQDSAGPKKTVGISDVEVHEIRGGAPDSDEEDLQYVKRKKDRPSEMSSGHRPTKRINVSDIEVQEVRSGAHSSFDSDMVVEEVRVGRKRKYDSDVIVEEVRHGQYDSDDSDLDVQEVRRGQSDSDSSDRDDRARRAIHSDNSRVDVREVRRGSFDSDSSGLDVREVRHGEYDSDASEFDVTEVRRGAYDSDGSHFDVEEVRYGSETDSSEMRVREVRYADFDSDASEMEFRTPRGHRHHPGHGRPYNRRGYRSQYEHSDYRTPYEHSGYRSQYEHTDYGSPYGYHTHNLRREYPTYAQRGAPWKRYVHDRHGYSSYSGYDSYDTEFQNEYLVVVDVMNKRSTSAIDYWYDRSNRCHYFTSKPPYLFSMVLEGGRIKWHPKGANYPNVVVVHTDRYGQTKFRVVFPEEGPKSHYKHSMHRYDESTVDSEMDYRRHGPHTHGRHHGHFNREQRNMPAHKYYQMPKDPYKQFASRSSPMYHYKEPLSLSESESFMGPHRSMRHYDPSSPFQIQYEYDEGKISGVRCNGAVIWKRRRHDPYPQSTKCISDILMIAIIFNKIHFHIYKFNGVKWKRIRASLEDIVELDISKKSSTDKYYYASSKYLGTYLAMEKYLFNKVKLTYLKGYHTLSTDIWSTEVPTDYADKVVVNRFGTLTKIEVTIHFVSGCEVTYLSPGLMKTFYRHRWSETASKISEDIQIITLDGRGGYEINNVARFDIYAHWKIENHESTMKGIYKYVVVFYENTHCVKVRVRNRKVFKTNPNLSGNFPTRISFNLETSKYSFEFSDDVHNYVFEEKIPSYLASS